MSEEEDERLVRGLGMSIAHGGVAYVPAGLRLENGHIAIPELVAMSGWKVKDVASAVRAAGAVRPSEIETGTNMSCLIMEGMGERIGVFREGESRAADRDGDDQEREKAI
ncbi:MULTISPECIES: hypothetical protein [unclassified Bradyrhizobium]|uniref:hypothetical protein n=1 Tax=unclassified Bradyrhizobium TaxID=2631580 RepID=UPI00230680B9|nr:MULTISPECIES: hypothetical protein [unclassified Bradyrhizobium]MDA9451224.1 hypothetical protein [Bradyrhizobium sp. CCBAU 21360]MDA9457603.1 hypothetical protein [Bradyrhizobium sp. CCBAU 21359]